MELNNIKVIKIGDLEFCLRYSNRALLAYLNRTAKDPENLENILYYYYDLAKTGAKVSGSNFKYTFDQFFDAIDPYPDAMDKFNEAVTELLGPGGEGKKSK